MLHARRDAGVDVGRTLGRLVGLALALLLVAMATLAAPAAAVGRGRPASSATEPDLDRKVQALAVANGAVVGLRSVALSEARSIETLGRERQGSGVVIDAEGLVLTIGYLVLEADEVDLVLADERLVPARVVAYDQASGFGLVQALMPLKLPPARFGHSGRLSSDEPLLIASGGEDAAVSLAHMVSRRAFSGFWEYYIEGALFTVPPRADHSGAALFNGDGELLGIGSLIVGDALGPGRPRLAGNMFVPIDLLKPILSELREHGRSRQSRRPWLGVNCVERDGQLQVVRITRDSPAEAAGLQPGDRIVRIDGAGITALKTFYAALWRDGSPEREVTLEVRRGQESHTLKVYAMDRMKTLRQPQGI